MVERFLEEVGWKRDRKGGNNRDYQMTGELSDFVHLQMNCYVNLNKKQLRVIGPMFACCQTSLGAQSFFILKFPFYSCSTTSTSFCMWLISHATFSFSMSPYYILRVQSSIFMQQKRKIPTVPLQNFWGYLLLDLNNHQQCLACPDIFEISLHKVVIILHLQS